MTFEMEGIMSMHKLSAAVVAVLLSAQATSAALQEKYDRGTRYLSGGVGQTEAEEIRQLAAGYSLNVLFATAQGQYLSGVEVQLKKANGEELLSTETEGPQLLVDLPPGRYILVAAVDGKTLSRNVEIAKGQRRKMDLRWPMPDNSATAQPK